jgi:NAD(P)-dependent dehydrogenase (short-subunit alcohol dehydrogenase family)
MTGAGSGIGKAVALRMAQQKIPLLLVGRSPSLLITQSLIHQAGGEAEIFEADLKNSIAWSEKLANTIASKKEKQWNVILAASTLGPEKKSCRLQDYNEVFSTNVVGNLAVVEASLPSMLQAQFGRVVFFAGGGAAYAYPEFPAYALSKVSTVRLTENLAAMHPPITGLSFVCVAPGAVETPMLARVIASGGEVKTKTDIEEPVHFIEEYCSSSSTALTGRYLHVRDDWGKYLAGDQLLIKNQFFLRRIS